MPELEKIAYNRGSIYSHLRFSKQWGACFISMGIGKSVKNSRESLLGKLSTELPIPSLK